jgi:hypothetical protein
MTSIEEMVGSAYEQARRGFAASEDTLQAVTTRGRRLQARRHGVIGLAGAAGVALAVGVGLFVGSGSGGQRVAVVGSSSSTPTVAPKPSADAPADVRGEGVIAKVGDQQARLCTGPSLKTIESACAGPDLTLTSGAAASLDRLLSGSAYPYVSVQGYAQDGQIYATTIAASSPAAIAPSPVPAGCDATGTESIDGGTASSFLADLAAKYSDTYAGGWIADGTVLVASFVGDAPANLAPPSVPFCTVSARTSLTSLQQLATKIEGDRSTLAGDGIVIRGAGVDQARNAVLVRVDVLVDSTRAELDARYGSANLELDGAVAQTP